MKIQKPEKKSYNEPLNKLYWSNLGVRNSAYVLYNQACDNWEKYHNYILCKLPTEHEIANLIFLSSFKSPEKLAEMIVGMREKNIKE